MPTETDPRLPDRVSARRPSLSDIEAILRLEAASDTAAVGHPDVTEADVRSDLSGPGFDRDRDAWLVLDRSGTAAAFGFVAAPGAGNLVRLDLYVEPGEEGPLGPATLAMLETRAVELVRDRGHHRAVVDVGLYRQQAAMGSLLEAAGYQVATTFARMYVEFTGTAEALAPAAGVEIRGLGADESGLRTLHTVLEDSFADHFGHVAEPFEAFRRVLDNAENSGLGGADQRWLAYVDGEPAGLVMANDSFVADENAGHVQMLGVRRQFRGRGIGQLLLRVAFEENRRRGRRGVFLSVDTNNVTGALRLYESVGMRPVVTIDIWRREIPAP